MKKEVIRVEKPWGHELIWARTGQYVGKILHINKGQQLSLQFHRVKEETIFIQSGRMKFIYEEKPGHLAEIIMNPGDCHHIPPNTKHRMIALDDCDVFEVSTPQLDDVVRIEDSYGRAES